MKRILVGLILLLASCSPQQHTILIQRTKLDEPKYCLFIRLYIPQKDGSIYWHDNLCDISVNIARRAFALAGIDIVELPRRVVGDEFLDIDTPEKWHKLQDVCAASSEEHNELAIYMVRLIKLPELTNVVVGGLSALPGQRRQHGMIISFYSYPKTLAHELGHQFGLVHIWDSLSLSYLCAEENCSNDICRFNIMAYCGDTPPTDKEHFLLTDQQISIMRHYCEIEPRNSVVSKK